MNGLNLNTVEEGTIFIGDDKLTYLKRRHHMLSNYN